MSGFLDSLDGGFLFGELQTVSSAGIPDPYTPPDGTFNITGALAVSSSVTATAMTLNSATPVVSFNLGSGNIASMGWNSAQTTDHLVVEVDTTSKNFVVTDYANRAFDHALAASTNPKLAIFSAAQSTTQYGCLYHDGTDFVLDAGAGALRLNKDIKMGTNVRFSSGSGVITVRTATDTDYATINTGYLDVYYGRVRTGLTTQALNLYGGTLTAESPVNCYGTLLAAVNCPFVLDEIAAPTGVANKAYIYAEDNGSGKTRLMVIFGSGAAQQLAIEP